MFACACVWVLVYVWYGWGKVGVCECVCVSVQLSGYERENNKWKRGVYGTIKEKCEVRPIHCWGSASAIKVSRNNLWNQHSHIQSVMLCLLSYLELSQTHTTGRAEKHRYGTLKCLQLCNMGTKCALWMYTIMSEVINSLPVLWISYVFWGLLTSLCIMGKWMNLTVLFQRVKISILYVFLHIYTITVP